MSDYMSRRSVVIIFAIISKKNFINSILFCKGGVVFTIFFSKVPFQYGIPHHTYFSNEKEEEGCCHNVYFWFGHYAN